MNKNSNGSTPPTTIGEVIGIKVPFALAKAPTAFTFDRNRELSDESIAWEDGYTKLGDTHGNDVFDPRLLLQYFVSKWKTSLYLELVDHKYIDWLGRHDEVVAGAPTVRWLVGALPDLRSVTVEMKEELDPTPPNMKIGVIHQPPKLGAAVIVGSEESPSTDLVFKIPAHSFGEGDTPSWRHFRPYQIRDGRAIYYSWSSAKSPEDFSRLWDPGSDDAASGVELIFCVAAPTSAVAETEARFAAETGFSFVDVIRADAAIIEQQWKSLEHEADIADSMALAAGNLLTQIAEVSNAQMAQSLAQQTRELFKPTEEIHTRKKMLADAASNLGYKLFLDEDPSFPFRDANGNTIKIKVEKGALYQVEMRLVTWTTWHTVTKRKRGLFSSRTTTYQVAREHSETLPYFMKVEPDYDPWAEATRAYSESNFTVSLFVFSSDGTLRTPDGVSLAEIMDRCDNDETFRQCCVVAVPIYETTIIGRDMLVGYALHCRPMRGLVTSDHPKLTLFERLSYRFTWLESRLGELAASIPLAPGEEREISLSRVEKTETSVSSTSTSLVEMASSARDDFETTFETEVRKETTTDTSVDGGLSGSFGGVKAGVNASRKKSVKDVSRTLNRAVRRTAQELTRRQQTQSTITTTQTSSMTTSNTVTYKVRNINQGATLNLALYRVMNAYQSALHLDEFSIGIEYGPALIEGLSYRSTCLYAQRDLPAMMQLFRSQALPIPTSDVSDNAWADFEAWLAKSLASAITDEYNPDEHNPTFGITWRVRRDSAWDSTDVSAVRELVEQKASGGLKALANSLENKRFDQLLGIEDFAFDSGALYIDAILGDGPATELYSEEMREIEKRYRSAKAKLIEARAAAVGGPYEDFRYLRAEYFTDGAYAPVSNKATIRIVPETLASTEWTLVIDESNRFTNPEVNPHGQLEFHLRGGLDYVKTWKPRDWATRTYLERGPEKLAYRFTK